MRRIRCPRCRTVVEVEESNTGTATCGSCSTRFRIPTGSTVTAGGPEESAATDSTLRKGPDALSPERVDCPRCGRPMVAAESGDGVYLCLKCGKRARKTGPDSKTGDSKTGSSKSRAAIAKTNQSQMRSSVRSSQEGKGGQSKSKNGRDDADAKGSPVGSPQGSPRTGKLSGSDPGGSGRSPFNPMTDSFVDKMEELSTGDDNLLINKERHKKPGFSPSAAWKSLPLLIRRAIVGLIVLGVLGTAVYFALPLIKEHYGDKIKLWN